MQYAYLLTSSDVFFCRVSVAANDVYPVVNQHNYGTSPCFMGKTTISVAIFNGKSPCTSIKSH